MGVILPFSFMLHQWEGEEPGKTRGTTLVRQFHVCNHGVRICSSDVVVKRSFQKKTTSRNMDFRSDKLIRVSTSSS